LTSTSDSITGTHPAWAALTTASYSAWLSPFRAASSTTRSTTAAAGAAVGGWPLRGASGGAGSPCSSSAPAHSSSRLKATAQSLPPGSTTRHPVSTGDPHSSVGDGGRHR
jgi:hypothetical protein